MVLLLLLNYDFITGVVLLLLLLLLLPK